MQWYGNVPAVVNVVVFVLPAAMFPLSQTPVSLVLVWAMPSLFFHVTVEPTVTVIVAEPNPLTTGVKLRLPVVFGLV